MHSSLSVFQWVCLRRVWVLVDLVLQVHDGRRAATKIFGILYLAVGHGQRVVLVCYWCPVFWARLIRGHWGVGPSLADGIRLV